MVDGRNGSGLTPLCLAIQKKQVACVGQLLALGANPDIECNNKSTLQIALEMVDGRDPNANE